MYGAEIQFVLSSRIIINFIHRKVDNGCISIHKYITSNNMKKKNKENSRLNMA